MNDKIRKLMRDFYKLKHTHTSQTRLCNGGRDIPNTISKLEYDM